MDVAIAYRREGCKDKVYGGHILLPNRNVLVTEIHRPCVVLDVRRVELQKSVDFILESLDKYFR
jgi:hypothetical protein